MPDVGNSRMDFVTFLAQRLRGGFDVLSIARRNGYLAAFRSECTGRRKAESLAGRRYESAAPAKAGIHVVELRVLPSGKLGKPGQYLRAKLLQFLGQS